MTTDRELNGQKFMTGVVQGLADSQHHIDAAARSISTALTSGAPQLAAQLAARPELAQAAGLALAKAETAAAEFDDTTTDDETFAQPLAPTGRPFTTLLMVEGMETSDGRMWELGTTTWRDAPLPFMVKDTSPHGPNDTSEPAWAAGTLDQIFRDPADPSRIMAFGHLMPNETGARAEDLARHSFRGVSIVGYGDSPVPPELQPTMVDQDGQPVAILVRYNDLIISELTMVPTPAFEATCLWFDDEEMPAVAANAHGMLIDADAEPEVVQMPSYEQMIAAGGGPKNPPREWFFTPEPDEYTPMSVTTDGHVTGHLAREGQCHIAYVGKCATAPASHTVPPFKGFHRAEAHCADETSVACGWIAMDTDHGPENTRGGWSNDQVWNHYENSGTLAAKVRASNGQHGIWLSGALLPGLSERQLAITQGLSVSGHWHTFADPETGQRFSNELLAVLGGVPFPGFPETRTRPELLVASGQVVGHIGELEPCDCDDQGEPMTPEETARIDAIEHKVDEIHGALVASGQIVVADLEAESAAALLEMDGIDLSAPLAPSEFAQWVGRYDAAAVAEMVKAGHARFDGSAPIADEADLVCALRQFGADPMMAGHLRRAASRLGRDDLMPVVA